MEPLYDIFTYWPDTGMLKGWSKNATESRYKSLANELYYGELSETGEGLVKVYAQSDGRLVYSLGAWNKYTEFLPERK